MIVNLNARIGAWWIMVLLMGLAMFAGRTGVIVLFAFALLRRCASLSAWWKHRGDRGLLLVTFLVATPIQYGLFWIDWYGNHSISIPV